MLKRNGQFLKDDIIIISYVLQIVNKQTSRSSEKKSFIVLLAANSDAVFGQIPNRD